MPSIVEYTDHKRPQNLYPSRIVSPPHAGPCCFTNMKAIGHVERDGKWEYRYRRCRTCGFTVRVILRQVPDEALIRDLRETLEKSFRRNLPDF